MMPLPLSRLYSIGTWLETNATDVIKETIAATRSGEVPNPMTLVARVLLRVDVSELVLNILTLPKNPETGKQINEGLTREFFDDYLDVPTAQDLFKQFIELNDLENLIKNLQSLPVVKKLMEASSLTFGIPFLSSLQQSTDSTQNKSEGSHSPKSTDSSTPTTVESLEKTNLSQQTSRTIM